MTEPATRQQIYGDLHSSADFQALRKSYRGFAIPWTITFFVWYMLYVFSSNWATDFMSKKVIGNINVALIFGLLQFVSTFLIAWLYANHANKKLDALASRLESAYEKEVGR